MITSGFSLAFNGKALLNNSKEMLWQRDIYQVTTSTDGHGSITATPMSGYQGTTVSLSNTPNANYGFKNYSLTGATLTGNQFTLNNDVTAMANFSALPQKRGIYGFASTAGYFRGYGRASATLRENYGINSSGVDWNSTNASLDITVSGWSSNANIPMKAYSAHSAYYDYFNWQNTEVYPTQPDYNYYNFTARGLKKDIHVTQVATYVKDAKFAVASSQNGPWLTAESTLPGLTQIVALSGFDWNVNDKIYFSANVTGNYKMSFTGYVLE